MKMNEITKIEDDLNARVYGPDMCETGYEDADPTDDVSGCTILTGKDVVDISLVLADGRFLKETWKVTHTNGKYSLVRPNGYLVRATSSESE